MIFPKDFENKTGFTPLRQWLVEKCDTRLGKEEVFRMSFSSDTNEIKERLLSVKEMVELVNSKQLPDLAGVSDIIPWLEEISAEGAFMTSEKLHKLNLTLQVIYEIKQFFSAPPKDDSTDFPILRNMFSNMESFEELENIISRSIGKYGEVLDNASPQLQEIRRQIASSTGSMHRIMQRVMDSAIRNGIIEKDTTPSVRDGRLVIPVVSGLKKSIDGIVHDQSATGKTVYIEPMEVVEASNRIKRFELEEQQEIIRILKELCNVIRPKILDIITSCKFIGLFDFIRTKAYFAIDLGGEMPNIDNEPVIELYHAVHPGLLMSLRQNGKSPVPLDIKLNGNDRILIISGPNAGGKSVALKTVAVIQYMMQCGLLPLLYSNSHMSVFSNIFIDIGDQQSIENDLSTYSSHLYNMKFFLSHSNNKTLVLADEMGSGTEPQIGGALAQSILSKLGKSGCLGVVTTHYQNIKTFADEEEGFINGAMLYDRQHLKPTFQLSIGNPGSSFAIEIAKNIGLPFEVIEKAKEIVGSDYINIDKFLLDIQRDKRYWQNKRLSIKEKEQKLDKLLETYESKSEDLRLQRNTILKTAREEAKDILQQANAKIERSIHEIKKASAEKEKTLRVRQELHKFRSDLENDDLSEEPEVLQPLRHKSKKSKAEKAKTGIQKSKSEDNVFKDGDTVKMKGGGVIGKIISIKGKKAEVAFGALRTIVDVDKLFHAAKSENSPATNNVIITSQDSSESRSRQLNFKNEIDVRGMKADEALQAVTYFIDDAIQFNIGRVRILHGTGFGVLRNIIREYLESHSGIRSFHDEDVRFGGAGITVVDLS